MTYIGRMNSFFVNNKGVRFDAGIIETALSKQPGIEGCAIVPKYSKEINDTVPVLYVQACGFGKSAICIVRKALLEAFSGESAFKETSLPAECVITDQILRNESGKVDVHRITKGKVRGTVYTLKAVCENGMLTHIRFLPKEKHCDVMQDDLLFGLSNILCLF